MESIALLIGASLNAGTVLRVEPVPNRCGRALAAEGRTARADADSNFVALAPTLVGLLRWHANAFVSPRTSDSRRTFSGMGERVARNALNTKI